jgi:tRNA(adenine34) deaminase
MRIALREARAARDEGEVPVGALLLMPDGSYHSDHNRTGRSKDPSAHAEHLVISAATASLGDWRLEGSILYTTLEPCLMCAGLAVLARVPRIVYGASDRRFGALGSVIDILSVPGLNHYPTVTGGIMAEESSELLRSFFRSARETGRETGKPLERSEE